MLKWKFSPSYMDFFQINHQNNEKDDWTKCQSYEYDNIIFLKKIKIKMVRAPRSLEFG